MALSNGLFVIFQVTMIALFASLIYALLLFLHVLMGCFVVFATKQVVVTMQILRNREGYWEGVTVNHRWLKLFQ